MRWRLSLITAYLALTAVAPMGQAAVIEENPTEPLDYTLLTHTLSIDALRAGIHNGNGMNEYTFTVTAFGLLNSSEERNLEFAKRKKATADLGKFGETKIDSLAIWHPDLKTKEFKELPVDGNVIRDLVARTMREFQATEGMVMVQVDINMMVRNKKFMFFGDDALVAKTSYYPIPATKFEAGLRTNQSLLIADDKGANVKIAVRYDKPAVATKPAAGAKDKDKDKEKDKAVSSAK